MLSVAGIGAAVASKYMYGIVWIAAAAGLLLQKTITRRNISWLAGWSMACALFFFLFDPVLWVSPVERLVQSFLFNINYSASDPGVLQKAYPVWQPILWLTRSIPDYPPEIQAFARRPGDFWVRADTLIFILAALGLPLLWRKNRPMFAWLIIGTAFLLLWTTK